MVFGKLFAMSECKQAMIMEQEIKDTIQEQAAQAAQAPVEESAEQPQVEADEAPEVEVIDEQSELQAQIDRLTAELEEQKKEYLFLRADFDNYRKRTLREREELIKNAAERVMLSVLPVVDDFERGLAAAQKSADAESMLTGFELIYNKLIKHLNDNGVKAMESTGKDFDADLHDAIATIPAPTPELKGKVVDTTTRGYMINDKVLRHAKVAVGE